LVGFLSYDAIAWGRINSSIAMSPLYPRSINIMPN
jgi:hypothetical protein